MSSPISAVSPPSADSTPSSRSRMTPATSLLLIALNFLTGHHQTSSQLKALGEMAAANPKLCVPSRASTLAVKLACESVFGEDVMLHSTVTGGGGGFSAL